MRLPQAGAGVAIANCKVQIAKCKLGTALRAMIATTKHLFQFAFFNLHFAICNPGP
jgi:hypothetical protein